MTAIRLAEHFGLSALTAINVLTNVYRWSKAERNRLILSSEHWRPALHHAEEAVRTIDDEPELRHLAREARERKLINASLFKTWLGDRLAAVPQPVPREGEHAPGYWQSRGAAEAAAEIRVYLGEGQPTPALRVVWDAVSDWIEAGRADLCDALLVELPPDGLDATLIVGLLGATYRAHGQMKRRAEFRRVACEVLAGRGRLQAEIAQLLGPEVLSA